VKVAAVQRSTGVVKMWSEQRGFGFLRLDDGREIFAHVSQCVDGNPLRASQRVSFLIDTGRGGRPIARQVVVEH
jgi:cold shock CspA family protein